MARSEPLALTNAAGHRLAARLDLPDGPLRACALFAHCFTCSKDLKAVRHIADALTAEGIGVLRFDFTGLGQSEGDFGDTTFATNVSDLVHAAQALEARFLAPRLLIGHSLGGAAVLLAAHEIPSAVAVATIGAPCRPEHVTHLFTGHEAAIEGEGEAEVAIGGRPFRITHDFVRSLEARDMDRAVRELGRALLVFHSPVDAVVGIENARHLYETARHPKSFVSLDHADHLLARPADARYVARVLAAWAEKYLDLPAPQPDTAPAPEGDDRVVAEIGAEGFRTAIRAGQHTVYADEPLDVGGQDTGPTPYDLLAGALGACTAMTLRMYAARKGWPLQGVTVRLAHGAAHAADCQACEAEDRRLHRMDLEIALEGPLDEQQRQRLLRMAARCPVSQTLTGEIEVHHALAEQRPS